jgi:hypothetical protein
MAIIQKLEDRIREFFKPELAGISSATWVPFPD